MKLKNIINSIFSFCILFIIAGVGRVSGQERLLDIIEGELKIYIKELGKEKVAPYFMSCRVDDVTTTSVDASFGVVNGVSRNRIVAALPEVRVGSPEFDNFHNNTPGTTISFFAAPEPILLPYESSESENAIKQTLWNEFLSRYKYGVASYQAMRSAKGVRAEESDKSPDFTPVEVVSYYEEPLNMDSSLIDVEKSKSIVKKYSALFLQYPDIIKGTVSVRQELVRKYYVSTEGARIDRKSTRLNSSH